MKLNLTPWNNEKNLTPVEQLFNDFLNFRGFDLEPFGALDKAVAFAPKLDVVETDKEVKVTAELPGLDQKDVEISIEDDLLTIRGEKKLEREEKNKNYYHYERSSGSFHRAIRLPAEVDDKSAAAEFKKGVLRITIPKKPESQTQKRRIEIKGE